MRIQTLLLHENHTPHQCFAYVRSEVLLSDHRPVIAIMQLTPAVEDLVQAHPSSLIYQL